MYGDQQGQFNYGENFVGRIEAAEYQLGRSIGGPAGNQLAGQALGSMLGTFLSNLFSGFRGGR